MRRSMADPNLVNAPLEQVQDLRRLPAGTAEVGDVWRILWCRRGLVATTVTVCFLATLAYVLVARSQYTAVAQILIDPRDRQIVTRDVNPDTLGGRRRGGPGREPGPGHRVGCGAVARHQGRWASIAIPTMARLSRRCWAASWVFSRGRPIGQTRPRTRPCGPPKAPRGQTGRQGLRRRRGGDGLRGREGRPHRRRHRERLPGRSDRIAGAIVGAGPRTPWRRG